MKTGLLIIASEVLNGKIKDLNTSLIADILRSHFQELEIQVAVADQEKSIHEALAFLSSKCDLIITAGGVGPTKDDITKATLASFFGKRIVYSSDSEKIADENYQNMGRLFPGKDHPYTFLPEGFIPLSNPNGFAPGFYFDSGKVKVLSVPGVPRELTQMLEFHLPKLVFSKMNSKSFFKHVTIRTRGVPEEKIFGEVDPSLWDKLEALGAVSSLPIIYGVDIGVKIVASSEQEIQVLESQVHKVFDDSPVLPHIWHRGKETVEEVILKKAQEKNLTFSFAESATGGLCSNRMTDVPGVSSHFFGGVICYDTSVKENLLGVSSRLIEEKNVVSQEVAQEMAIGVKRALSTDLGISITGLAGPGGGTEQIPVGTVCIGVAGRKTTRTFQYQFKGDRSLLKNRFAQIALFALLDALEENA